MARGVVRDGAGCVVRVFDGVAVGDGDSSEALGSGIGTWSFGLNGTSPSAGGCTGGIACSRSPDHRAADDEAEGHHDAARPRG